MYQCDKCHRGYIELDTDSFVTNVLSQNKDSIVLETSVKGYCLNCSAEHVISITDEAIVKVRE